MRDPGPSPRCGGAADAFSTSAGSAVRMRGPSSVTATVCSKCALRFPSTVTTVHLSGSVRVFAEPTFTIGSMASVIPASSFGPRFGLP